MKKILLALPLVGLFALVFESVRTRDTIGAGFKKCLNFIRKVLAFMSGFLTKRVHEKIDFTVLEETDV